MVDLAVFMFIGGFATALFISLTFIFFRWVWRAFLKICD